MSRQTSQPFRCHPLAELTRQLLFAPADRRIEQIHRTELLHDEIEPTLNYPFDYLTYRITGYRSESTPPMLLMGQAVTPDLRLIIDRLSHSVSIPVTDDDPVETPEQLALRLGVSTKTIARWRTAGLRWRWVTQPGQNRKSVAFTPQAIEQFISKNTQRVTRASRHTHTDSQTRQWVIDQARQMALTTRASLNTVAAHLAQKTGRAHQTIRHILEHHDREHDDHKLFVDRTRPLSVQEKRAIIRAYRTGTTVATIALRFGRTRSTIYRAIRHRRAAALRRVRISYTASALFERQDADRFILDMVNQSVTDASAARPQVTVPVDDLPYPIQELFGGPAQPPGVQHALLQRFNYLKYQADQIRIHLDRYSPRSSDMDHAESCLKTAAKVRTHLVTHNLPIVLSVARRHLIDQADRSVAHLVDLLDIGTTELIAAIDRYDVSRAQTFGAYATWALMRRFLGYTSAYRPGTVRAHRKLDSDTALRRVREAAAARGVRLISREKGKDKAPPSPRATQTRMTIPREGS